MPYDSNGNFTLNAGYLAVAGQTIQPSQHNPVLEDIGLSGLNNVVVRDGRAAMTGNLNMGAFRVRNIADGTLATDAISKGQLDAQATTQSVANRGYIYGLTLSNNAVDATNDIDIAAGAAAQDTATPAVMVLAASLTKRLDAAWAVGTGNGGLDTGSIANTTYHIWLIQRSDTGVVDVLFSASATAPTMPANYDRKRRIGSILRESAAIVAFHQDGNMFRRAAKVDRNSTAGFASALLALSVPTGIPTKPLVKMSIVTSTASTSANNYLGSAWSGSADILVQFILTGGGDIADVNEFIISPIFETNTSAQLYFAAVISAGVISQNILTTLGWIDERGMV